jgi:hypothetical protein
MAYIGKQPLVGNFTLLDSITATTTDTYALTKDSVAVFPQTPANCIVSLNGVIQAPTDSYTISGSDIVFASALTASDSIDFITVLGDVLNIGTPSDNTVSLAKLTATGTKDATTFLRGDNTFASAGGANTPAFRAYRSTTAQAIPTSTDTKVQFNSETFDTASAFDSTTNYRFTPQTAGKYFIHFQYGHNSGTAHTIIQPKIFKNGSVVASKSYNHSAGTRQYTISDIISFNGTTDYVEGFIFQNFGSDRDSDFGEATVFFEGFRIIE